MSEELITYLSPRLRAMSVAFLFVGLGGIVLFFWFCAEQKFFGAPVGLFESVIVVMFFAVLLGFLEYERHEHREGERFIKFCKFGDEVKKLSGILALDPDANYLVFMEMQPQLIEFAAKLNSMKIPSPSILLEFDEIGWTICSAEWTGFLENLYLASLRNDLKEARKLIKPQAPIIPGLVS